MALSDQTAALYGAAARETWHRRGISELRPVPPHERPPECILSGYGSGPAAVDAFSLDVAAGEFVSLLGASGSGKTTTLMMVAGFTGRTPARSCSTAGHHASSAGTTGHRRRVPELRAFPAHECDAQRRLSIEDARRAGDAGADPGRSRAGARRARVLSAHGCPHSSPAGSSSASPSPARSCSSPACC